MATGSHELDLPFRKEVRRSPIVIVISGRGGMLVQSPDSKVRKLEMLPLHFTGGSGAGCVLKSIGLHRPVELQERGEICQTV